MDLKVTQDYKASLKLSGWCLTFLNKVWILPSFSFFGVWLFNYFCCCGFCLTGIMFQDITTLLLDHKAFKDTVDIFVDRYRGMNISVVAGNLLANPFTSLLLSLLFVAWFVFWKWLITGARDDGIMGISGFHVFHVWILALFIFFPSLGCWLLSKIA